MKKLLIINTGGTFSSVESERGLKPGLSSRELLEAMRLVAGGIELEMEDLFLVDSANIFPDDWRRLAERIYEAAAGYQGIVVIHGTDTMAYTASMLSFMLQNVPIPVVLTGSQLSISHPVADAMENCRCAVHMAAGGHGGVFLAFNRKVMLGVRASKVRTMSFDAFESINYPDVAQISSLGLRIHTGYLPEIKGGGSAVYRILGPGVCAENVSGNPAGTPVHAGGARVSGCLYRSLWAGRASVSEKRFSGGGGAERETRDDGSGGKPVQIRGEQPFRV